MTKPCNGRLRTTQLGAIGLQITRVGFGAWAIGRGGREFGWGPGAIAGFRRADQVDLILTAASIKLTGDGVDDMEAGTRRRIPIGLAGLTAYVLANEPAKPAGRHRLAAEEA
jgi:aryl-alcohol dehydrogenase-like predicted oxidoreductase